MTALRIYSDFHGLVRGPRNPERTAVVLDTFGSLRDLANAGLTLKESLHIIAFDWSDETKDLEGHGTAEFDRENGSWVVEFDEQGVRDAPAGDRTPDNEFRCVSCRAAIEDFIESNGLTLGDKCPDCGTAIQTPIAPPST